ncbi:trehalase family glycosidase [Isoptericola sp. NPDC019482]|uniref:amylo-alpha-1,6-glucosidase n=1 Tax=Isoptericola sp. NPDC019482 TaxID=3154688 RepID=UPI00348197A1
MTDRQTTRTLRRAPVVLGAAAAMLATVVVPAGGATGADGPPDTDVGLERPFALPGYVERDDNGALLVGEGESRFALRVDLLTAAGKLVRENQGLLNNVAHVGPVTVDGSYYEVEISSDDRSITPDRLGALREILAHPDEWSADQVAEAREQLPTLQARYDQTQRDKQTILLRFARTAPNTLVGSVTARDADATVFLEAAPPWDEENSYALADGGVRATGAGLDDPSEVGHFALLPTQAPDDAGAYASEDDLVAAMEGKEGAAGDAAAALRYDLEEGETITFTTSVADEPPADRASRGSILGTLARARAKADDGTLSGSGPAGRAATAMRSAMALNTNYDEQSRQSFLVWGWGRGGAENDSIFTGWDSAWDAITALTVDPDLARQHERVLFASGGPRYDQLHAGPMHAYAVKRIYDATGDRELVEQAYPALVEFFDKLPEWDVNDDGLLEAPYDGDPSKVGNHLGLDDLPVYLAADRIAKEGGSGDERDNTDLTDVALTSYYALMADSLTELATALDRPEDAHRFAAVLAQTKKAANDTLWDDERGMYLDRNLDGTWGDVVTPTIFYPLFGGLATPERAARTVEENLLDPEQFWGEYAIPSISRDDAEYCANGDVSATSSPEYTYYLGWGEENTCEQWRGAVWPPMNATVYDGLKRYGLDGAAGELATKSTSMYLDSWDENGFFPEYFDPEPGQVVNASAVDSAWRYYTWSNVMPLMAVHELVAEDAWGRPGSVTFGSHALPGRNTVDDVRVGEHTYAATVSPRTTALERDGRTVFRSTGGRVVVRDFALTRDGACFDVNATGTARLAVTPRPGTTLRTTVREGSSHVCL